MSSSGKRELGPAFQESVNLSRYEVVAKLASQVKKGTILHQRKDQFWDTVARALELFEFTIDDPKWRVPCRLREITRVKELFSAAVLGSNEYNTSLEDLDKYFLFYACIARENR